MYISKIEKQESLKLYPDLFFLKEKPNEIIDSFVSKNLDFEKDILSLNKKEYNKNNILQLLENHSGNSLFSKRNLMNPSYKRQYFKHNDFNSYKNTLLSLNSTDLLINILYIKEKDLEDIDFCNLIDNHKDKIVVSDSLNEDRFVEFVLETNRVLSFKKLPSFSYKNDFNNNDQYSIQIEKFKDLYEFCSKYYTADIFFYGTKDEAFLIASIYENHIIKGYYFLMPNFYSNDIEVHKIFENLKEMYLLNYQS